MSLQSNPQLELAFEYVRNTSKSVFLTGKAGSGKTTFLRQIRAEATKRMAVVAPTGVAAINAGGMTIHSLFQLPLGLHLPGVQRQNDASRQFRLSKKKINLLRSLDLLVIDEISMVRADVLDAVDEVLRRVRDCGRPFGGVQLLMIGDLHQLPPVVKPQDWQTLARFYDTPYFFGSRALAQTDYVTIELRHIYRQSDSEFIELLNKVRDNRLDAESLRKLNSRYVPDFKPPPDTPFITLTATNAVANSINNRNLRQLPGKLRVFKATIDGTFPESAYPTELRLEVKPGAQVMFIRNDLQEKRYFNGKIGQVTKIDDQAIYVRCPGEATDIPVGPNTWENVRYTLNEQTKQIEEQTLGTFTQYPLKLAWAITIHKSQGLTFDRAIIDAGAAFTFGQVYVALSRCKSFEGIVLRSPITQSAVKTDPVIVDFTEQADRDAPSEAKLQRAKREYQASSVRELFQFDEAERHLRKLSAVCSQHASSVPEESIQQVQAFTERAGKELFQVTDKFAPALETYLAQDAMPEANEELQNRIRGASAYFTEKLDGLLQEAGQQSTISDNKEVAQALESGWQSLQLALFVKRSCFAACRNGFETESYNRAKVDAELEFAKSTAARRGASKVVPKDVPHPALYRQLLEWREQVAQQRGVSPRDVVPNLSLRELVSCLPTSTNKLRDIPGIGKARQKNYGRQIIELIERYRAEHRITDDGGLIQARPTRRASETKQTSFDMYRSGMSVEQIAAKRGLKPGTIENHLAQFIEIGELNVEELVDGQAVADITSFFTANPQATLTEAKAHFGERYSYSQLRLVRSHFNWRGPEGTSDKAKSGANGESESQASD